MKHKILIGILSSFSTLTIRAMAPHGLKRSQLSLDLASVYYQSDSDAEESLFSSPRNRTPSGSPVRVTTNASPLLRRAAQQTTLSSRRSTRLTPRIQEEMRQNDSLETKVLTPRSRIPFENELFEIVNSDTSSSSSVLTDANEQLRIGCELEKAKEHYEKLEKLREDTLPHPDKRLLKALATLEARIEELEYPYKLQHAQKVYNEHYAPGATQDHIKLTFPAIFNGTITLSPKAHKPGNEETLMLQIGMVKNDLSTVIQALAKGARPDHDRISLNQLCSSPEHVPGCLDEKNLEEHATNYYFKGDLVVGLCAILAEAHAHKANKDIRDPQQAQKYRDNLSRINTLVWNAYEDFTETV